MLVAAVIGAQVQPATVAAAGESPDPLAGRAVSAPATPPQTSDLPRAPVEPTISSRLWPAASESGLEGDVGRATNAAPAPARAIDAYGRLPLSFEANAGQSRVTADFLARGGGYVLATSAAGATLWLRRPLTYGTDGDSLVPAPGSHDLGASYATVRMHLVGADLSASAVGEDELPGRVNYFIGNDPAKWRTNIATFAKVKYSSVYPGVDVVYYGTQRQLEFDFVVAAYADPDRIALAFEGGLGLTLDQAGDLVLSVEGGELILRAPHVYQETGSGRALVSARYVILEGDRVGLRLDGYDASRPLIIDPVLAYSTFLGGISADYGFAIAVDSAGNAFVTGQTSTSFPTVDGSYDTGANGSNDAFVSKFNAAGSALVYSTYLGGAGPDFGFGIALDSSGNAYVTGRTDSDDFPTTEGALFQTFQGLIDAFVTKLNPTGSALVYSTYLGGSHDDRGWAIDVGADGTAYVTGQTTSQDFHVTNESSFGGGISDAFVTRLNASGSAAVYSTYLGGSGPPLCSSEPPPPCEPDANFDWGDVGKGIAVGSAGEAYVTGVTDSPDFPTTAGVVFPTHRSTPGADPSGYADAFVTRFNAEGAIVNSTFLGGTRTDRGEDIAWDIGNVHVTGGTASSNFPNTDAYDPDYNLGGDGFLTTLNTNLSALAYSTYIGGAAHDEGRGVAAEGSGHGAWVYGLTQSDGFPTVKAVQGSRAGGQDAFVMRFDTAGSGTSSLLFSTYLGGRGHEENVGRIALGPSGSAYVVGATDSTNFPTTSGAYDPTANGSVDTFVVRLQNELTFTVNTTSDANDGACDEKHCSLREALLAANANAAQDLIRFDIPGPGPHTIHVTSGGLPTVADAVTIDATTQPGWAAGAPIVELDGSDAGASGGFNVVASDVVIRGFVINRFAGWGIVLGSVSNVHVEGNFIGTDTTGTLALPNGGGEGSVPGGIGLIGSGPGNVIGGESASQRNVVSGNAGFGIFAFSGDGNTIMGNFVGTNAAGSAALANTGCGIALHGNGNIISGNLVSGNAGCGIHVNGGAHTVQGNRVGTNQVGDAAIQNTADGVVALAPAQIGGAGSEGNLISGNGGSGIVLGTGSGGSVVQGNFVGTDAAGTGDLGNVSSGMTVVSASNTIGGTSGSARNVIAGNGFFGIWLFATAGSNQIQGNYVGVGASGAALGNGTGVRVDGSGNTIGGAAAGAGNVISGNATQGVHIFGSGASGNLVQGNIIGLDPSGAADITTGVSGTAGVFIEDADGNTIGGIVSGARNVISGNQHGISIVAGSSGNTVLGNYIGTNASGTAALGNTVDGILLEQSPNNTVGGAADGARNVVSGNGRFGINVAGAAATGNVVQGNYVGPDAAGTADITSAAPAAPFGGVGVVLNGPNNMLGGSNSAERNIISANGTGVLINGATGNNVNGNWIGLSATDAPLGNSGFGIHVANAIGGAFIGGETAGLANRVAHNGGQGIAITASSGSTVMGNDIFENAGSGIEISADSDNNVLIDNSVHGNGGNGIFISDSASSGNRISGGSITANEGKGIALAEGANNGIQPPTITDVSSGSLTVSGTGVAGALISVYLDPEDEGKTFLKSFIATSTTWSNSDWSPLADTDVRAIVTALKAGTLRLTATQTLTAIEGPGGETSEFSGAATMVGVVTGFAECPVGTKLFGAKVELFSGSSLVLFESDGSPVVTLSDPVTAAYTLPPVAFGTYTIVFTLGGTRCGTAVVVDDEGVLVDPPNAPPIDLHNHSWPAAHELTLVPESPVLSAEVLEHIFLQDQSAWFKFRIQPESRVVVTLTGLPANYDLTLYKNIAEAYKALTAPEDLVRLSAEFAPDAFAPDAFAPDAFAPDAFAPDAFAPDAFAPDAFAPDAFAPDAFAPDAYAPDAYAPDAFAPDAFAPDAFAPDAFAPDAFAGGEQVSPDAFASAQTRSLIAVSAFEGTSGEGVVRNTWDNDGYFYVRVRGRNGAFSLAAPFHLEVRLFTGQCEGVTPPSSTVFPTGVAGGYQTIILWDRSRTPGTESQRDLLAMRLGQLAARPDVAGVVVRLDEEIPPPGTKKYPRVAEANATADAHLACTYAKNLVAGAAKEIVDAYRAVNPLQYVVIVGGDGAIPFFRHPDQALLAPEKNYQPPVRDASASQASLKLNRVLSDNRYGSRFDISRGDHGLPIQDLAVGRLVENASDIVGMIDTYLATAAGVVTINSSALVTGYDFIADVAEDIRAELAEALPGGTVDTLILAGDQPPTSLSAWTADDLRTQLLDTRHDIVFLGGHFSASSALAADYKTRLLAREVVDSTVDLSNVLLYSIGCHSGYAIPDADGIPGLTSEPDFAQAFAQKRITSIIGTGYQYGDTEFVEYSERLYLEFTRALRAEEGPIAVGKALVAGKRALLAGTAQLRGIHEKAALEATLFGLPMLRFDLPGPADPGANAASVVLDTQGYATDPGLELGLRRGCDAAGCTAPADIVVTPALTEHTVPLKNTETGAFVDPAATYFAGPGDRVVANPGEPVLPLEVVNVSAAGATLRGVGFREANYTDLGNKRVKTGAPTTEIRTPHGIFLSDVLYPIRPWNVNYFDALYPGGQTYLMLTPMQYVSTATETGTLRRFTSMTFRLFYSANVQTYAGNTPALAAAPAISKVVGAPGPNGIEFKVTVGGDPAAGIQEVWVTYTGVSGSLAGQWRSLDLSQAQPPYTESNPSTLWTGTLSPTDLGTTPAADVRFIVQAVNGVGVVSLDTNRGAFYVPGPEFQPPSAPKEATSLVLMEPPAAGEYREERTFSARLTSGGTPLPGRRITFGFDPGAVRRQAVTDDQGVATTTLRLLQPTGDYDIHASFQETSDFLGSSDAEPFTITKQGTTLTLTPGSFTGQYTGASPFVAELRDTSAETTAESRMLREQTVFFRITGNGHTYVTAVQTDFEGQAPLLEVPLPAGTYTVQAHFAQTIALANGQSLNVENDRYEGSASETATLVLEANAAVTYTGESVIPAGTTLDVAALVSPPASGAFVHFVVRDGAGAIARTITGAAATALRPVDPATGAAFGEIPDLGAGLYTVEATATGSLSSPAATALLAVFDESSSAAGGGWITTGFGATGMPEGKRSNFGVNLKFKGGAPSGGFEFQLRDGSFKLNVKATQFGWLVISTDRERAEFLGVGTIDGSGPSCIHVVVTDASDGDTFAFRAWQGTSCTDQLPSSPPTHAASGTVDGGEIRIR